MPEQDRSLKQFYKNLSDIGYNDLGTYESFSQRLQQPDTRRMVFDRLRDDGHDFGDYNQFSQVVDESIANDESGRLRGNVTHIRNILDQHDSEPRVAIGGAGYVEDPQQGAPSRGWVDSLLQETAELEAGETARRDVGPPEPMGTGERLAYAYQHGDLDIETDMALQDALARGDQKTVNELMAIKDRIREMAPEERESVWKKLQRIGAGFLAGGVAGGSRMVGQEAGDILEEMAVTSAGILPIVPQTAKEGLVGAAAGTLIGAPGVGYAAGMASAMSKQGQGMMYYNLVRDKRIDPEIAKYISAGASIPYAAIEGMQIKGLSQLAKRALIDAADTAILRVAGRGAMEQGKQVAEEIAQEIIQIGAEEMSVSINNQLKGSEYEHTPLGEHVKRVGDTAMETLKGTALLTGLPTARSIDRGLAASEDVKPPAEVVEPEVEEQSLVAPEVAEGVQEPSKALMPPPEEQTAQITDIEVKEDALYEPPPHTPWDKFVNLTQDEFRRVQRVQKAAPNVSEGADVETAVRLYPGRAGERIQKFKDWVGVTPRKGRKSFLGRLVDAGFDAEQFGYYLYAKHAAERNEKIKRENPDFEGTGSGMTEAEAQQIFEAYDTYGLTEKADQFAEEFYQNVTDAKLQTAFDSGLIDQELFDKLKRQAPGKAQEALVALNPELFGGDYVPGYKYYVPLKGWEDFTAKRQGAGTGQGFSVTGKTIIPAKGRTSKAQNPFVQALADYEQTVIRAEKNRVTQKLANFMRENPSESWSIDQRDLTPQEKLSNEDVVFYEDGKRHVINIGDEALGRSIKRLGVGKSLPILRNVNNYIRTMATTLNPEFLVTNMSRDIQTALTHLSGEQAEGVAREVAKGTPSAIAAIISERIGDGKHPDAQLVKEFRSAGGKTGWAGTETFEDKQRNIEKEIKSYQKTGSVRRAYRAAGQFIGDMNEAVENGVRFATYKTLIEQGVAPDIAAKTAKDLTVDFDRKGELGSIVGSLYLFSNAGIQGTARIARAATGKGRQGKRIRRHIRNIAIAGFLQSYMNRLINEDEWEQFSDYDKDNYWIQMLPNGKAFSIKVPYGYNVFKVMGSVAEEMANGGLTKDQAAARLFNTTNGAFNPIGGGSFAQTLSPTIADPFMQLANNENFFGGPIKPEQAPFGGREKPESQLKFKSVRNLSDRFAMWLNERTGGTTRKSGAVDISPETIDHWVDFFGSGAGKFLFNTADLAKSAIDPDKEADIRNIPFVRQAVKTKSEWTDKRRISEILDYSSTNSLDADELKLFNKLINRALDEGNITATQATQYRNRIKERQQFISAPQEQIDWEAKRSELMDVATPDSKQAFFDFIDQGVSAGYLPESDKMEWRKKYNRKIKSLRRKK